MEQIVQATQDELLPGLNFKPPSTASYILEKKQATIQPQSGGTFSPAGVRVIRFHLSDPNWLDPTSVRVSLNVKETGNVNPLIPVAPPNCLFNRLRVLAGSQVIEDISHYNRTYMMYHSLLPTDRRCDDAIEGWGLDSAAVSMTSMDSFEPVPGGDFRRVSLHLLSGLLSQPKLLPLKVCPLTIELHIGDAQDAFSSAVGASTTWLIENAELKCNIITLDSLMDQQFHDHLRAGRSLYVPISTWTTTMQAVTAPSNYRVDLARGYSALKTVIATQSKAADNQTISFYHKAAGGDPTNGTASSDDDIEYQIQIGSAMYPTLPVRGFAESFYRLREALGIHVGESSVNITPSSFKSNRFMMAIDVEKANVGPGAAAAFTGANTRQGSLISVLVKGPTNDAERCYITCHYDAVMTIRGEGGVELAD